MNSSRRRPKTVICIPGIWNSRREIVTSIAKRSGGYLFAGDALINPSTGEVYKVDLYHHDPVLVEAFANANSGSLTSAEMEQISVHRYAMYLVARGGSVSKARSLMNATSAVLQSGGIAVKIESSGVAHSAAQWIELTLDPSPKSLYSAFVVLVTSDSEYYACGMHNLGLPDASVSMELDSATAKKLLDCLLLSTLEFDTPSANLDCFTCVGVKGRFKAVLEPCVRFPSDDLFYNPYGNWRLVKC